MLVLQRKCSQTIQIGNDVTIKIVRIEGKKVRIGIDAPDDVPIVRRELVDRAKDDETPDRKKS